MDALDRYRAALSAFQSGATWDGLKSLTFWAAAAELSEEDVIADARAQGVKNRDADIRRGMATAKRKTDEWNATRNGRGIGAARRNGKPHRQAKPQTSYIVSECIEAGLGHCTSAALMELSPVDVRRMGMAEQRVAQFRAMFDRMEFYGCYVGIAPRSGAWTPRLGHDFMTVEEWLADGARRVAESRGQLVKLNPFTGASAERGDGKSHLATSETLAAFPHILMEFDELSLDEQCAFWHGVISLYRLPVVALTYSGGKSIHGVVRVDRKNGAEFARAVMSARQTFATDLDKDRRLDVQSLSLPVAGARLAGCVRSDTGKPQRLLYVRPPDAQERPRTNAAAIADNHAPETDRRAADPSTRPTEPDADAPLDELLAFCEVCESIE